MPQLRPEIAPARVITGWKNCIHRDQAAARAMVRDAAPRVALGGVCQAENWEDDEDFRPYLSPATSSFAEAFRRSRTWITTKGRLGSGARVGVRYVVAPEADREAKRRGLESLP